MPLTAVRTLLHPPKKWVLSFDGTDDYMKIYDSSSLRPSSWTVILWMRYLTTEYVKANTHPFYKYQSGVNAWGLINKWGAAPIMAAVYDGTTIYLTNIYYMTDLKWHMVTGRYDADEPSLSLFIDGSLFHKKTNVPSGLVFDNTADVKIPYDSGRAFQLAILQVYNRALSASEIQHNKENPMNPVTDGLVLWLKMEEGSGTTVHDYSGYGNDGTIYGATWTEITHDPVRTLTPVRVLSNVR